MARLHTWELLSVEENEKRYWKATVLGESKGLFANREWALEWVADKIADRVKWLEQEIALYRDVVEAICALTGRADEVTPIATLRRYGVDLGTSPKEIEIAGDYATDARYVYPDRERVIEALCRLVLREKENNQ